MSTAGVSRNEAAGPLLTLGALAETVDSEARLITELSALLHRLREAVAADDLAELERCVYSNHRVLMTVSEARRRRTSLVDLLGLTVQPLERNPLREQFERLRAAAYALKREVEVTREVLRRALESGDELMRAACAPIAALTTYDRSAAPTAMAASSEGTLLNQRA